MNRLRKSALMHALLGMAAAWAFTFGAADPTHAQTWSEYAMVSATMGVSDGRVCVGEGSRGDIGCPAYAPYIDATTGNVGIGTDSPFTTLHVSGTSGPTITASSGWLMRFTSPNAPENRRNWAILDANNLGRLTIRARQDDWSFIPLGINDPSLYIYHENGYVGVGRVSPTTRIDISGTLRLSSGQESCDTNRTGAIKYQSGDFFYCRNGTAWESLTSLSGGGGTAGDRITSGTTGVYTYSNTSASIATAGVQRVVVGTTGNVGIGQQPAANIALSVSGSGINLTNPSTDPSLTATVSLMAAGNIGAGFSAFSTTYDAPWADPATVELAAYSNAKALQFRTSRTAYGAPFIFKMGSTGTYPAMEVARITSTGLALGVITPTTKLEVAGRISTTTVQLANDPVDVCDAGSIGAIKSINGRIYVCRQ